MRASSTVASDVMILDDVFSSLDAHVSRKVFDNIKAFQREHGITFLLVTHNQDLVGSHAAVTASATSATHSKATTVVNDDGFATKPSKVKLEFLLEDAAPEIHSIVQIHDGVVNVTVNPLFVDRGGVSSSAASTPNKGSRRRSVEIGTAEVALYDPKLKKKDDSFASSTRNTVIKPQILDGKQDDELETTDGQLAKKKSSSSGIVKKEFKREGAVGFDTWMIYFYAGCGSGRFVSLYLLAFVV